MGQKINFVRLTLNLVHLFFGSLLIFFFKFKNLLKKKEVIASQSIKTAQMQAKLPQAERGVWGAKPPTNHKLKKFKF